MRALVLQAFGRVGIEERPEPQAGLEEVVVAVDACGICGSDVHGFLGEEPRRQPGLVLGHECVGRLVEPVDSLPAGTRVAINPLMPCGRCRACVAGRTQNCPTRRLIGLDDVPGAFAERTVVARRNVFPVPDQVADENVCLTEPLACAVHLFSLVPGPVMARTVLFGGGTLGAMLLVVAKRLGYGPITVVEPSAGRREIALALGADEALDPREVNLAAEFRARGDEVELAIDAVGAAAARQAAVAITRPGGAVMLLGTNDLETTLEFRDIVRRELRLQASYGFCADDFARALGLVTSGAVDLRPWTRCYPLERGQEAFQAMTPAPEDAIKLILRPNG